VERDRVRGAGHELGGEGAELRLVADERDRHARAGEAPGDGGGIVLRGESRLFPEGCAGRRRGKQLRGFPGAAQRAVPDLGGGELAGGPEAPDEGTGQPAASACTVS
jgi:hypothetical protein